MKTIIKKIPIVGPITRRAYRTWIRPFKPFTCSETYWIERYESGRRSGDGSYGKLAQFKADVLNDFVREKGVKTVIEYGCGDGNQLTLAEYPAYKGFDVSLKAIALCRDQFSGDTTNTFMLMSDYKGETAELTLSLDVVFHLVEDAVFNEYMNRLFDSAEQFVIVYSSNTNRNDELQAPFVRHRKFTDWVKGSKPEWKLRAHLPNAYPPTGDTRTGSHADFYIFEIENARCASQRDSG